MNIVKNIHSRLAGEPYPPPPTIDRSWSNLGPNIVMSKNMMTKNLLLSTRCPIARHRTVNARPRTLLVYEGKESHFIKNIAATVKFFSPHKVRTATVRCRAARHRTFVPCYLLFSSITFMVRCRAIGQRDYTVHASQTNVWINPQSYTRKRCTPV